MEAQYKLSTGEVFQDVSLVPSMLSKGKLGLFPEGGKGPQGPAEDLRRGGFPLQGGDRPNRRKR